MNEIDYLLDTYYNKEDWHETRLSQAKAKQYYEEQLRNKNIVFLTKEGELAGYLEIWWLNKYQAANVLNNKFFDCMEEDLSSGDIVYAHTAYIEEEHRGKGSLKELNQKMKEQHKDRDYVGIMYKSGHSGQFSFYKKGEI